MRSISSGPNPTASSASDPEITRDAPGPRAARNQWSTFTAQPERVFALVGGTLHPACGPTIHSGTLIVREGKIAAIGPAGTRVPPEAQTIELGLDIWPGLIDAGSTVGLSEIDSLPETQDFADASRFEPELRTSIALRPDSEHLPVTRANGVLTTYVQPTGGLISGQGCVINLQGWVPRELLVEDQVALNVTIPAFVPRPAGGQHRGPRPGQGGGEWLRTRTTGGRSSLRQFASSSARPRDTATSWPRPATAGLPRRLSICAYAPVPYAKGQKPVIFQANHRTEILDALAIAKELKLKAVISGGAKHGRSPPRSRRPDVPVIVAGTLNVPSPITIPTTRRMPIRPGSMQPG